MTSGSGSKVAVMALAMVGRMAHYIMESGEVRPMMIVQNFNNSQGCVNGIVFLDVANDPPAEAHDGSGVKVPYMSVSSVPYGTDGAGAGTWRWPNFAQHVEADAAGVLEHVSDSLAKFRSELLGHVNAKLEAHVEAVGKIADNMSAEFQEHVSKLGSDVAAEASKVVEAVGGIGRATGESGAANAQPPEKVDAFTQPPSGDGTEPPSAA